MVQALGGHLPASPREAGFSFSGGGGGRALWPDPPPKGAQLTGPPKYPQKPTYLYVPPHHGLPLEPHELVRLTVASRVTIRVSDSVAVGIRVRVRARARVRVRAGVRGGGRGGARRARARGCSRRWCMVSTSQAATWSNLCRDTLRTQPTTRRNLLERRCQAQLVPTNRGRMCTLTNENVIPIRCITTEA